MYRENIFEFISGKDPILFIPTNKRMLSYLKTFLPDAGLDITKELDQWTTNKPVAIIRDDLRIIPERAENIPDQIRDMICKSNNAYGLTGDDLFDEYQIKFFEERGNVPSILEVKNNYDWFNKNAEFKRPALCLLTKKDEELPNSIRVAASLKYEKTIEQYLRRSDKLKGKLFKLDLFKGGIEEKVTKEGYDCCVDIVDSGNSYKACGLEVSEKVRFSDIVLIGPNENRLGEIIIQDYNKILERRNNPKQGSYTTDLLSSKKKRRDKIISEAAEVFSAIENGFTLPGECADLIYALNVVMVGQNVDPRDVFYAIQERIKTF